VEAETGPLCVLFSPQPFARDLRLLSTGQYAVEKLTLLDMFPQTYHVECVGFSHHLVQGVLDDAHGTPLQQLRDKLPHDLFRR